MIKQLFLSLFFLASISAFAQHKTFENITETQDFSKKLSTLFHDQKISEVFDELAVYWPLPTNELEDIKEKTVKYQNILQDRFGSAIGVMKVKNETIGSIAVRETYILQHQNTGIRLIFTYYKNKEGWIVNAFSWDDSFEKEFK